MGLEIPTRVRTQIHNQDLKSDVKAVFLPPKTRNPTLRRIETLKQNSSKWFTLFGSPSLILSRTLSATTSPSFPKKNATSREEGDISGRILNRKLDITPTFRTLTHWWITLPRAITYVKVKGGLM